MSKGKNQHVVKDENGWAVKGAGNSKATKVTQTQKAVSYTHLTLPTKRIV